MQLCPFCSSENIFFSKKRHTYFCEDCENAFDTPSLMKGMRIFLSYGHDENARVVQQIKDCLTDHGYDVWIDSSQIPAGKDWRACITNGLIGSNGVLSFLSKHSVRDPGVCLDELKIAVCLKHAYIKTVLLESETEVAPPRIVSKTQWIDMSDWRSIPEAQWDTYFQEKMALLLEALRNDDAVRYNEDLEFLGEKMTISHNTAAEQRLLKQVFIGRNWLAEKAAQWLSAPDQEPFMIFGVPGSGKSAFSANFAQFNPDVLAVLFFEWDHAELRNVDTVIKYLAFRLAATVPDYRRMLCNIYKNEAEQSKLSQYHGAALFDCLILDPLQCCIDGNRETGMIILDGLDETTPEIADLLVRKASRFPKWIKVMLTSRYDETLVPRLQQNYTVMLDQSHEQSTQDICRYLAFRLELPADHTTVLELGQKCEGSFMYASTFCDAVDSGNMAIDDAHAVPFGLQNFYHTLFKRLFPTNEQFLELRPFLELLCIDEDIPEDVMMECLQLDRYGLWELRLSVKGLIAGALSPCGSGNAFKFKTIRFSHQSIKDWLTDLRSAGEFFVDVSRGYRHLAEYYEQCSLQPAEQNKLPPLSSAGWYQKLQSLKRDSITEEQLQEIQNELEQWNKATQEPYEKQLLHDALKNYGKNQYIKWLIRGGEYGKAKEALLASFDAERMTRDFQPRNYTQYYKYFTLWQWADLFPLSVPIDDLVEKFTEIALFPRNYMVSQFTHRSFQIVLLTLRYIMDSGRFREPFYKVMRSLSFASYFTSAASDDGDTRDGWDKYYMTRDAVICIKKLDKCGIAIPQDVRDAAEKMKLTFNCDHGDPGRGMFYGKSGGFFSYGILSEPELFKDLCVIGTAEEKVGFCNTLRLLTHYNTVSLRFYLACSDEEDMDYIRRSIENHADLSSACEQAEADIRARNDSVEAGSLSPKYAGRLAFIRSLPRLLG